MVKKYNSFLLESHIKNLMLLEGYIFGSSEFLLKLKELSNDNDIAKSLYQMISREAWISDSKIKQNYFDLTDSNDKVSFIQQNKLPDYWDEDDNPDLPYSLPRNELKIGRAIKYLFDVYGMNKPSDKEVEEFVNSFKASKVDTTREFKLVKGDDIAKYYHKDKYFNRSSGVLGGSCMLDEGKKMFKIYTKNPKKVKLLILVDNNDKIHGRALVWKLDKYPKGGSKYFMDRIYTNSDSDMIKFKKFAKENGWMYKYRNNSHIDDNVTFDYDGVVYGVIEVELDGDFKKYPFIDTMCFLDKKMTRLSNVPDKKDWVLHDIYGNKERCEYCNGKLIFISWSGKELCSNCSGGHEKLKDQGIETKWNRKV